MQDDTAEQRQDERDTSHGRADAVPRLPVREGDPCDQHEEGGVHVDADAGKRADLRRPLHGAPRQIARPRKSPTARKAWRNPIAPDRAMNTGLVGDRESARPRNRALSESDILRRLQSASARSSGIHGASPSGPSPRGGPATLERRLPRPGDDIGRLVAQESVNFRSFIGTAPSSDQH